MPAQRQSGDVVERAAADLIAIFPRRQARLLLEEHAQIFGVLDAEGFADLRERHVRLDEEFAHGIGPHAQDLLVRRAVERLAETRFENAPRQGDDAQDIVDADVLVGVLPDEGDRFGDVMIVDGQYVG